MKQRITVILITVLALSCVHVLASVQPTYPTINGSKTSSSRSHTIILLDGMSTKPISGKISSTSKTKNISEQIWKSTDGYLIARIQTKHVSAVTTYRITVSYSGSNPEYRLLKLSLALPVSPLGKVASFWDGLEEHRWDGKSTIERDDIEYTFPLSCIWNGKSGLAVGFTPDTITSSLHSGVRIRASQREIFYETKLVVDSKHPQTVTYIAYPFKSNFGYLDAVQQYYDLFAKWFRPVDNIDQRIYGFGGYFTSSYNSQRLQLHSSRRAGLDWEWSYAPWVVSADYYPDKKDWVEGRDPIRQYRGYRDEFKGTWEGYHQARVAQFAQGDKTAAMFYYLLVKDGNMELVTKGYPDAQSVLKNGSKSTGGMNALPNEVTTYIFPYGTELAEEIENDLRQVVANYKISGFAFDMANHGIDDYGPAQLKFGVGRSYDENWKIYSPDTLTGIFFADAIHKMKQDGKRMGVIMNQAISASQCFAVFHSDGVMYEQGPAMNAKNVMPLRLMSGRKPMTFWGSVECARLNSGIRWDYMADPEMAAKIMSQLNTHYLLTCLRIGASCMTWATRDLGFEWVPVIEDLKRAGWNPASAVISSSSDLWIGRFGCGSGTILTISNPKRYAVKADLSVLSSYIGKEAYAFVSDQGQLISQQIRHDNTSFKINLKPKEIMILRTFEIKNPGKVVEVTTQRNVNTSSINFKVVGAVSNLTICSSDRDHLGFAIAGFAGLNKRDITRMNPAGYEIKLTSAGNRSLVFEYEPATRLLSPKADILAFYAESDAMSKDNQTCIVIPDNPSKTEITVAEQLESYYSFINAFREYPAEGEPGLMNLKWETTPRIPIYRVSQPDIGTYGKHILVGKVTSTGYPKSMLSPAEHKSIRQFDGGFVKTFTDSSRSAMWIGGKTDMELSKASDIYFKLMDRKTLGVVNWVPRGY